MQSSITKRTFTSIGWALIIAASGYFIWINVLHYFNYTRASFTDYFWPNRNWLLMHIAGGLVATVVGPFQFIQKIRRRNVKVHRTMGKIYLISIAIGAPAGFYMAVKSQVNFAYAIGLATMATIWFTSITMAYISIRKGNIIQHREWMTRSYVVTFAFTTFRLADKILADLHVGPDDVRATFLSWACWSIPLFVTELFLQASKVKKIKKFSISKQQTSTKIENPDVTMLE